MEKQTITRFDVITEQYGSQVAMRRGLVARSVKGKGPTAKTVQNQIEEQRQVKYSSKN